MPVPVVVIDANGITVPEFQDILDGLKADYRAIYGADVYLEADSQDGQLLAVFAQGIYDSNAAAMAAYQAFSPQTAQGNGLSRMVKINGITRKAATHSTVTVSVVGTAGTTITGGIVQDASGSKWALPATVTIPGGGSVDVTATAQDAGEISAGAGEVSQIATPTLGWLSVTNATSAAVGVSAETDAQLRTRQRASVSLPALTVREAIHAAVAAVDGVTTLRVYENDTAATDVNGLARNSIAVVVAGGANADIANAIWSKKSPGTGTNGEISTVITDANGGTSTIKHHRPSVVPIDVAITVHALVGYTSTTGALIKANVAAALNALGLGTSVLYSGLYGPILAADAGNTSRTFDVTALTICRHTGAPGTANLAMGYDEMAAGTIANITLTVT